MKSSERTAATDVCIITDRQQWNEFLMSQSSGHLLQSYEWGELLQFLGGRVHRIGVLEDGRMVGAMMLSVAPVPMPVPVLHYNWLYCSRGPVVADLQSSTLSLLIEKAHKIAREEHAVVLRLEPNIADDLPEQELWLEAYQRLGFQTNPISVHGRRSWVLDIRPDMEQLLANFRKAWRQNIRLAERRGVIVREAQSDKDFDAYYALLKSTSERDNFFVHSKDYHREILQQFSNQGNAVLFLAEYEGEPVAAKMLIRFGDWCWDMFAGTSESVPNLPKGHILQYHSILWAKAQGCKYFDFRTIPEKLEPGEEMWSVYHYKKGFGGFSRLNIPTQDYIYRPFIYKTWHTVVELRRAYRRQQQKKKAAAHLSPPEAKKKSATEQSAEGTE